MTLLSRFLLAVGTALALPLAASAAPINTTFNFVPTTTLVATPNITPPGNLAIATAITSGAPDVVTDIMTDNTGLVSLATVVTLTDPDTGHAGCNVRESLDNSSGHFYSKFDGYRGDEVPLPRSVSRPRAQ